MSGCTPDQMAIVIASRVTVLQLHILSRKFPPFLGFLSVADRTTNEPKVSLYKCALREHFVRFPDCQFVDCAERLRHENGKMIYSPFVWVVLWGVNGVVVFFVG